MIGTHRPGEGVRRTTKAPTARGSGRTRTGLRAGLIAVPAAALLLVSTITSAVAAPLEPEHFHDSFSAVIEDFCGEITARIDEDATGTFLFNARGQDGLAYGMATVHRTLSLTNLANDKSWTSIGNFVDKDLKVTDNGDGTLTIVTQFAGGSRHYGPDGEFLGAEGEVLRTEILIDDGGTPNDPTDDELLEFLGVVKGELVNGCPEILGLIG